MDPIFSPALTGDVQKAIADINLIKEKIGWKPTVFLEKWIEHIISMEKFDDI